jgi:hypothetical protein
MWSSETTYHNSDLPYGSNNMGMVWSFRETEGISWELALKHVHLNIQAKAKQSSIALKYCRI